MITPCELSGLELKMIAARFPAVAGFRSSGAFDLWVVARKSVSLQGAMRALTYEYLPSTT